MWVNEEGERVVALRADAARRVLGTQLGALPLPLSLTNLPHTYRSVYGHALLPSAYGCSDLISLLRIIPDIQVLYHPFFFIYLLIYFLRFINLNVYSL